MYSYKYVGVVGISAPFHACTLRTLSCRDYIAIIILPTEPKSDGIMKRLVGLCVNDGVNGQSRVVTVVCGVLERARERLSPPLLPRG